MMAVPPSGAPTAPMPVVAPQFCAPYVVPLTVTKKAISLSDGDFAITDANGALVLRVKGAIFSMRHRRVLLDAAGLPLLSMQEKVDGDIEPRKHFGPEPKRVATAKKEVFSMHNRWEVFRGDSTSASNLVFTLKNSSLIQLKTEMDVFLAANTAEQVCDYKIKGSFFDRSSIFYLGNSNTIVAQIKRKMTVGSVLLDKDTFDVTVFPNVDYVFIASLVVILEEVHRDKSE